jgi:hypothetical protein
MFMQPGDSMIHSAAAAYGVLSKNFLEHLQNLLPADGPLLDQTDHHLQIREEVLRRPLE